jgi:hypothetical protein
MMVCGYCGSEIELDGEILHNEDCTAPVPYGDEDDPASFEAGETAAPEQK